MGSDRKRGWLRRRAAIAVVAALCLGPACGQAPPGGEVESDVSPAFAANPMRVVAAMPFISRAGSADDPDGIAAPMAASLFASALLERRGVELALPDAAARPPGSAAVAGLDDRMREFYDEWIAEREFADPEFVREIADSVDAVLVGAVLAWEQRRHDDGFETCVEIMAGLFDAPTGKWLWYGQDRETRTAADKPPDFARLLRDMVAALVATVPNASPPSE